MADDSVNMILFPDTVEEFMEEYKVVDRDHVLSNGLEFVPVFRMKQWFDHIHASNAAKKPEWPNWTPLSILPEYDGVYLCCKETLSRKGVFIPRLGMYRSDTGWMNIFDEPIGNKVTHWMPLPAPPAGEVD